MTSTITQGGKKSFLTCLSMFLLSALLAGSVTAQTVYIPDANFKAALLADSAINTNSDDEIQVSETSGITAIDASGAGISDITGLEAFQQLLQLNLSSNNLTSFDASGMGLDYLGVANNQLTSLYLGGIVEYLDAAGNPDLNCIETSNPGYYEWDNPNVDVDEEVIFSPDCSSEEPVVYIPDANFKAALLADAAINTNGDDEIQVSETSGITAIDASEAGISDITGLEAFQQLLQLNLNSNDLTSFDASGMGLDYLGVANNQLTSLYLGGIVEYLDAAGNPDLHCIQTSTPGYYEWDNPNVDVDEGVTFSPDCSSDPVVHIPDANFKAALLADEDINTNGDDEIQVSEAEAVTGTVKVNGENISDLRGIGAFVHVYEIKAHDNNLSSVDLSANADLKKLHLQGNQLSSLDLSANVELDMLRAQNNMLTALDMSANTQLRYLEVNDNELTSLNVKNGNNSNMYRFEADGNPALSCIQVDDQFYAEVMWEDYVDPGVYFSTDCGSSEPIVYIPDTNFKAALVANTSVNINGDAEIQVSEAGSVVDLNINTQSISDLTGIEAFEALAYLYAIENNLSLLDVRSISSLVHLDVKGNQLTELRIPSSVEELYVDGNLFTTLDLSSTGVTSLGATANANLNSLNLQNGATWTYLDVRGTPNLACIQVDDPAYFQTATNINEDSGDSYSTDCGYDAPVVYIPDANFKAALLADDHINFNGDDEIQVFEAEQTDGIYVAGMNISDMTGIEAFINLIHLHCQNNNITSLDLSHVVRNDLGDVRCYNNQITEVKLPGYTPNYFLAQNNQIEELELSGYAEWVDVSNNDLQSLKLFMTDSPVSEWSFVNNPNLNCVEVNSVEYAEDTWSSSFDAHVSFSTDCGTIGDPVVHIPDANFKAALLVTPAINTNADYEIQVSEAEGFTGLIKVNGEDISDLTGIEAFVNITGLKAHYNMLTSVDLSANVHLEQLHLQHNDLTSLDLSANTMLDMLRLQYNELTSLDVGANTALRYLEVQHNALVSLNVKNGNNSAMYKFKAEGNLDLTCIEVDDAAYAASNWSDDVDGSASFSEACSGTSARIAESDLSINHSLNVSVFPNPSADFMTVQNAESMDELRLYSVSGEEMHIRFVNGEVDIRHLKKGIYILRAYQGKDVASVRLVKQ